MVFMKMILACLVGELAAVIAVSGVVVGYKIGSSDPAFGVLTVGAAQGFAVCLAISAAVVYAMRRKWSRMSRRYLALTRNLSLSRKAKGLLEGFHEGEGRRENGDSARR